MSKTDADATERALCAEGLGTTENRIRQVVNVLSCGERQHRIATGVLVLCKLP